MRIVALDFETANEHPASACALGISIYEEGEVLDSFEWYLKPPHDYNYFVFTYIHGITSEDVQNENEFVYYYEELKEILKDSVIVAHNAMFDINVLNACCDIYGLDHFHNEYLDTVAISRIVYPHLKNHKLNTVSDYLNIDLHHHNGKSDAYACLMILLNAMEKVECYDVKDFMKKIGCRIKKNK